MGNRAVITTKENFENNGIGIYLHWNGGRDSVEAFLKYCELHNYREPTSDCYGWAYLTATICNFFGDGMSVGIDVISNLDTDNYDNGTYIIDGWKIVDRKFMEHSEQHCYDMTDMLESINEKQPVDMQLPKELLTAEKVPTSDLKVGDKFLYLDNLYNKWSIEEVVGIGEDRYVNGHKVAGVPYTNKYGFENPADNPNNYIYTDTALVPAKESEVE